MPATFLQPDEPDPTADPCTRPFRLAVLSGYCVDLDQARAILDVIEEEAETARSVLGAIDVSFVMALACDALDRKALSHHDLVRAMERVGIDPTKIERIQAVPAMAVNESDVK